MPYKPREVLVDIKNVGNTDFVDELVVEIPYYKKITKKLSIPLDQSITAKVSYDEYLIPRRKYNIKAYIIYNNNVIDTKAVEVTKKDSIRFVDVFFNKLPDYMKRLDNWYYWRNGSNWLMYYKYGGNVWIDNNGGYYVNVGYDRHGAGEYLEVYPFDFYVFLEAGFNYELEVQVIEQASFCYEGSCSCVSWPNKYTTAFVNMCGPQDDTWDYVYHDKSEPEVRLSLGNKLVYGTIMTGAYKKGSGYIADSSVTDKFTLVIEQKDEKTYTWAIKDFTRSTSKPGRVVLANVDYRKEYGEFELGGISGTDTLGRKVNITNVIPLRIEAYSRVGCSARYSSSDWPKSHVHVTIKVKKVY